VLKDDVRISVPKPDPDPTERIPVSVSLGCHVDGVSMPKPDLGDTETAIAGVAKRFAGKVPKACPIRMRKFRRFVRRYIRKNFKPLAPDVDTTIKKWLEGTNYPEWRKAELLAVLDRYHRGEVDMDTVIQCMSFLKDEFYAEFKHARGINARHDVFKCLIGPIFKLIETEVYKDHHFIKHVPVAQRPKYIRDLLYAHGVKYYASDYTSFEALFVREFMEVCEFELYEYMTQHLPEAEFMRWAMDVVLGGTNLCNFKRFCVQLQAVRMSGEMCTSLGNGWANLMAWLFLAEEAGCEYADGVVEGDDGLFALKGSPPTVRDFESLGLIIKLEEHDSLSTASFCGIVFDDKDMINIADPRKVLASFGWASSRYVRSKPKILKALLRCKALSLLHQYPGAPVIQALAAYGLRVTDDVPVCKMLRAVNQRGGFDEWHRKQIVEAIESGVETKPVPLNTRFLMEEKFHFGVSDQLRVERYLDSLTELVPLRIDAHLFPSGWKQYFDVYVRDGSEGRHPSLAVPVLGPSIMSLFERRGRWLVPRPVQPAPPQRRE
jgi:hypothetical protein